MPDELYPDAAAPATNVAELMPYEVPFRILASIGVLVILLFTAVAVGAFVVEIPETVRVPFQLVPEDGAEPVVVTRDGTLEQIRIQESQLVQKGDVLVSIRADEVREWRRELETLEQDFTALDDRRGASEQIFETKVLEIKNKISENESRVAFQQEYLAAVTEVAKDTEELRKRGLISETEQLSRKLGVAEARRDVAIARQAVDSAKLELNLLETERITETTLEDIEHNKLFSRIHTLRDLLAGSEGDEIFIRAPYDGVVLTMPRKRSGDPVVSGEELCRLARVDAMPRASLAIPQKDIPQLQEGQAAKLFFDSYPYQRYGTVAGRLAWLSPAAMSTEGGPMFQGWVALDRLTIESKGKELPLNVGMSGLARINVGRRTLIDYAFQPIRQLRESMTPAESESELPLDQQLPYEKLETTDEESTGGAQ